MTDTKAADAIGSAEQTADAIGSAEQTAVAEEWLRRAAVPGRAALRLSAALLAAGTVLAIAQWWCLAVVAQAVMSHTGALIVWGVAGLVAAAVLAAAATWASRRFEAAGRARIVGEIRNSLAVALLPRGRRTTDPEPAASAHALVELADQVADYHARVEPLRISAPVSMVAIFVATALVHWPAAIVLLLSSALVPLNMKLAGIFAQDGNDRHLLAMRRLSAMMLESFHGLSTLINLGAVDRRRRDIDVASRELTAANLAVVRRAFLSGLIMDVVVTFSIAANATYIGLSLLGYVRIPGVPPISLAAGLFVLLLCPMYFAPLRSMAAAFHDRERATTAAKAIASMLSGGSHGSETQSPRAAELLAKAEPVTVSLRGVRYQVPDGDRQLFAIPGLQVEAGSWTAVTGVSGAGKTTLLSLIGGLREPTDGTIEWRTSAAAARPMVGRSAWIGQQTVILEDTVAENVRLGRADATDAEITEALRAAGLEQAVNALSRGIHTIIGDGGWGVSTGEARRIAIARALVGGARLWILDEPTAHLDPESELVVLDALKRATRGSTVVVATHSAAVVNVADAVWNLEEGVVEVRSALEAA
ncbi:MAG TPA: ATP-binding cassette domain-containing protein [Microbacteriaceae bacterium]|jgi:ATP-binding cassette subfamily C protein CydD|nr:ATP-binding cassette domain-containing protein [Microbacteriaceae bacterium]